MIKELRRGPTLKKIKRNIGIFTTKLTILCYDQKLTSLQSNGMSAIPKIYILKTFEVHNKLVKNEN